MKALLFFSLLLTSLQSSPLSYSDLLETCDAEQLQALQAANDIFALDGQVDFQVLEGGLTRAKLYSFTMGGEKYVLRFMALGPNQPLEMRKGEMEAMSTASKLHIAPPLSFSDENAVLMIMPFIEGTALHHPNSEQLNEVGKMVKTLHEFKGSYPTRYTFLERLQKQYEKGLQAGIAYPTGFAEQIQKVLQAKSDRPMVPSHSDLNPSNILAKDAKITFIDWTTATWDDPFVDVSYFCLLANLSPDQEMTFLTAYFGRSPTEPELQVLREQKAKTCLLTATIWFRFSEGEEQQKIPMATRIAALNEELYSPYLKPACEYLRDNVVVNIKTAEKSDVTSYALSFYKAFLDSQ